MPAGFKYTPCSILCQSILPVIMLHMHVQDNDGMHKMASKAYKLTKNYDSSALAATQL